VWDGQGRTSHTKPQGGCRHGSKAVHAADKLMPMLGTSAAQSAAVWMAYDCGIVLQQQLRTQVLSACICRWAALLPSWDGG
jgi:hypothetical protein